MNTLAELGAALDAQLAALTARLDCQSQAIDVVAQEVETLKTPTNNPPLYAEWEAIVKKYADIYAAQFFITTLSGADRLDLCYYDAAWIYANLAYHFKHPDYLKARDEAIKIYRDGYVLAQAVPGKVAGWMIFPHGLAAHYKVSGDEESKRALFAMADYAAYAQTGEPIDTWLTPEYLSREAAYNLMCKDFAQDLGHTGVGISKLTEICLGHLAQWRSQLDGSATDLTDQTDCRPFMVAITCQALIERYQREASPAIKDAITATLNLMWDKLYVPASKAFQYSNRIIPGVGDLSPAPDLNLLIAPAYAWLGQRDRADLLFQGSVSGAFYAGHKQFNQSLRWVFEYLKWRVNNG